jgi:hypothetical protein
LGSILKLPELPGILDEVDDQQQSLYEVAQQVVDNVAAGLAGYLGPGVGTLAAQFHAKCLPFSLGESDYGAVRILRVTDHSMAIREDCYLHTVPAAAT